MSTQHLVNHVLPVVISLKHVLEATKSPLQGLLMEYLMVLVKNHKGEVEQVSSNVGLNLDLSILDSSRLFSMIPH